LKPTITVIDGGTQPVVSQKLNLKIEKKYLFATFVFFLPIDIKITQQNFPRDGAFFAYTCEQVKNGIN